MPFPTITATQQFAVSIEPKTRTGKPAVVDGSAVWASSNEAVASVVSTGPLTGLVVAQAAGDATISAAVDADLGEGVNTITGQDTLTVTQGTATSVGLTAGPVEEQP